MAADLVSAEQFIRTKGDAVTGVLESINLGGISTPICRDGRALVDGGYLNNIPADTLVRQGANFVISVNVSRKIRMKLAGNTGDTPTRQMKTPRAGQVLSRIREITQMKLSLVGSQQSDFVIYPDVSRVSFADFKSAAQTAEIGYKAAMAELSRLSIA
ncbi:MAG: hypothetical protein AAF802_17915 [Planctomycetota bacterium]